MADDIADLADLDRKLARLNGVATALLRAERLKLLGEACVKTVWFDNQRCQFYIPDALDDRIQSLLLANSKFFEEPLLRQARQYISEDSVVIDIGANIGNHSVFFSKICKAKKVFSFEPQARLVEILERNKSLNNLSDEQVTVFNCGCGDTTGQLRVVHQNIANLGATRFAYDEAGGFEVRRLDDCEIDQIDFLKIDAERMGDTVLRGAEQTLERNSPVIWIELYDDEAERAIEILNAYGYTHTRAMTKADHLFSRTPL